MKNISFLKYHGKNTVFSDHFWKISSLRIFDFPISSSIYRGRKITWANRTSFYLVISIVLKHFESEITFSSMISQRNSAFMLKSIILICTHSGSRDLQRSNDFDLEVIERCNDLPQMDSYQRFRQDPDHSWYLLCLEGSLNSLMLFYRGLRLEQITCKYQEALNWLFQIQGRVSIQIPYPSYLSIRH